MEPFVKLLGQSSIRRGSWVAQSLLLSGNDKWTPLSPGLYSTLCSPAARHLSRLNLARQKRRKTFRPPSVIVERPEADPRIPIVPPPSIFPSSPGNRVGSKPSFAEQLETHKRPIKTNPTRLKSRFTSKAYATLGKTSDGSLLLAAQPLTPSYVDPSHPRFSELSSFIEEPIHLKTRLAADEVGSDPMPDPSPRASPYAQAASLALPPMSSALPAYSHARNVPFHHVKLIQKMRRVENKTVKEVADHFKCSVNYVRQVAPINKEERARRWVNWFRGLKVTDQRRVVKRSLERKMW